MTDFLVKTCKQQTGRQVRVAETCGPFPFFLHHHHLGDLWSECQQWKYTNRYSLIIYSQVYIPKTVTFHYFQLCLKTIPSEVDPFSPLIALVSKYKASQQARYSKHQQWSRQQIQAAHVRTGPECWLNFLCISYTGHHLTARTERVLLSLSGNTSGPGSRSFDTEKAGFKANWTLFYQCSKN